jgi:hypothetical protein
MRNQTYALVDAIPVITWDRWAAGRCVTTDEFRLFVHEWVVASAALYRYARMVGGTLCEN